MAEFIAVHECGVERMVNLAWVEEVWQNSDGKAVIYFAFQSAGYFEQDSIKTDETYDEVKRKIWR